MQQPPRRRSCHGECGVLDDEQLWESSVRGPRIHPVGRVHSGPLEVDNSRTKLVILLPGDRLILKRDQSGDKRGSTPDGIFTVRWSNHLASYGWWSQPRNFRSDAVDKARKHRGATRENDITEEVSTNIDVALHDRLVDRLVDAKKDTITTSKKGRPEKSLRATKEFVPKFDDLTVGKLVGLFEHRRVGSSLHL